MFRATGVMLMSVLAIGGAVAEDGNTDWQVVATFRDGGAAVCQLRVGGAVAGPTLQIEGRTRTGGTTVVAYFRAGNLPRLTKAAEAQFTDVTVTSGEFKATGAKANWTRGTDVASSRLTFFSDQPIADLLGALRGAKDLTIAVPTDGKATTLVYSLAGSDGPLRAMEKCLAPDIAAN